MEGKYCTRLVRNAPAAQSDEPWAATSRGDVADTLDQIGIAAGVQPEVVRKQGRAEYIAARSGSASRFIQMLLNTRTRCR